MRVVSVVLSVLALSQALIEKLSIENDDRSTFHIESFAFTEGGKFEASIEDFGLMVPHDFVPPPDEIYEIAFVLQISESDIGVKIDSNKCFHHTYASSERDLIVYLRKRTQWSKLSFSKTITKPGYYHLYYSNCVSNSHSSFNLETKQYNVDSWGKNYLSYGLSSLPTWFFVIFLAFVGLAAAWGLLLSKNWANARSIHFLMMAVLAVKCLSLFTETFQYHSLKVDGVHDGWSAAFYVFSFLKGMLLFTTIVLIGTGWSYLKPFLTDRDKQLVLAVIVVQAAVNIAMVAVDESTPGSYGGMRWRDILHILDIICCCAILFPIVWSIRHLRAASSSSTKAARNMNRLQNFRTFYLLVVIYIYFTRIVLFLLEALLPYTLTFLGPVFNEIASFIFYAVSGWLFRPQEANPYLALGKDDDDADLADLADAEA